MKNSLVSNISVFLMVVHELIKTVIIAQNGLHLW